MATTVQIENDADELLDLRVVELKKRARKAGKPTRDINKMRVLSDLIKRAFGKANPAVMPPAPSEPPVP